MIHDFLTDPRFAGIKPFESKIWLSSPTMHGEEQKWVDEAIRTNWVSTVGSIISTGAAVNLTFLRDCRASPRHQACSRKAVRTGKAQSGDPVGTQGVLLGRDVRREHQPRRL